MFPWKCYICDEFINGITCNNNNNNRKKKEKGIEMKDLVVGYEHEN